jgi:heme-degrading monooxygenase HmoA
MRRTRVSYAQQLQEDSGPIVLINEFNVAPEDVERFLEVWADNAALTKQQPGFIYMQIYRGTAGSTTFGIVAVWESAKALGHARRTRLESRARRPRRRAINAQYAN